jgi:Ca2+/Na+ antiporter
MKFIFFLAVVLVAIVALLLIRKYSSLEFVSHAKLLFKTWSVWLASVGSAITAWVQSFPDDALNAWNALPTDVKSIIPQNYLGMIGAFMVAMAVMAQFVRQNRLAEQRAAIESKAAS